MQEAHKIDGIVVTVIIPTYHDWNRLEQCLEALSNQSISNRLFEIIIVNNDPEDLAPTSFVLPVNARLISEAKPGSYAARNAAVQESRGYLLAFTDSDCIPHCDWLEKCVEKFSAEDLDRLGGKVSIFTSSDKNISAAELYDVVFAFPQQKAIEKLGYSVTANLIVKRSSFLSVGLFNESLFSGGDYEWNQRANKLGMSLLFCPDVIVNHPARKSIQDLEKKARRIMGSRIISKGFPHYIYDISHLFLSKFVKLILATILTNKLSFREKLKVTCVIAHLYKVSLDEFIRLRSGEGAKRE